MKKLSLVFATFLFFAGVTVTNAQDTETDNHTVGFTIPDFAILDIEEAANKNITLILSETNLEAGSIFDFSATDATLWLNYTAFAPKVSGSWETREVNVKIDELVPGLDLKVLVGAATGGIGTLGSSQASASAVTLTTTDQAVITGIGSCYTGNGTSKGHNLTYSLAVNNYSLIEAGTKSVTVTYTIADE